MAFTHILHFADYQELGYCETHIRDFVSCALQISVSECDGDAPNELVAVSPVKIRDTVIRRIKAHFEPIDAKFNQ